MFNGEVLVKTNIVIKSGTGKHDRLIPGLYLVYSLGQSIKGVGRLCPTRNRMSFSAADDVFLILTIRRVLPIP